MIMTAFLVSNFTYDIDCPNLWEQSDLNIIIFTAREAAPDYT